MIYPYPISYEIPKIEWVMSPQKREGHALVQQDRVALNHGTMER